MQKKYIAAVAVICILFLSYLFYYSCKRDTIVIRQTERVAIPDSCWLYGSLNLKELRKDIAWSSIINGDLGKLFQTDTSSNALLKILKSPSSYSIYEQNNIRYFSLWKNQHVYTGLLFTIENNELLLKSFKSTAYKTGNQLQYSFRSNEGYWLFNDQQLLFIGNQQQDSILAHSIFSRKQQTLTESQTNDSLYTSCIINTLYYQDSAKHCLLDSAYIHFRLKKNDESLVLDWNYNGPASAYFNQTLLTNPDANTGLYLTCNPSRSGLKKILKIYQERNPSKQRAQIDIESFISILQNNNFAAAFNGWKKQKKSFFLSELNDEFEMVLVKKDSSFLEPSFTVALKPSDKKEVAVFLNYLQREGLISKNKQSPFRISLGNFDSELYLTKDSLLVYQNKHAIQTTSTQSNQEAACILQVKPAAIENLYNGGINFKTLKQAALIEEIHIEAFKEKKSMYGTASITFNADKHPILALIQVLRSIEQ